MPPTLPKVINNPATIKNIACLVVIVSLSVCCLSVYSICSNAHIVNQTVNNPSNSVGMVATIKTKAAESLMSIMLFPVVLV